jgi:hypothetical protein
MEHSSHDRLVAAPRMAIDNHRNGRCGDSDVKIIGGIVGRIGVDAPEWSQQRYGVSGRKKLAAWSVSSFTMESRNYQKNPYRPRPIMDDSAQQLYGQAMEPDLDLEYRSRYQSSGQPGCREAI